MLLLLLACAGGKGPEEEEKRVNDPRTLVEVAAVSPGDVADWIVTNGVVESEAQADIVPEATGVITAIHVEEGQKVRKGQVLAVMNNVVLSGALEQARANNEKAQQDLARVERLHAAGAVSDRELTEARYAAQAAATSLEQSSGTAGQTRIVSPVDGTVAVRDVKLGDLAGGRRAFQVVDLARLKVVARLPERDLSRLKEGQSASLVGVYDAAVAVKGRVERISPTVDAATGTVRVTVSIEPGQSVLRPGQFVSVRIEAARHDGVLSVPRAAVVYDEGRPHLFRVAVEEPPKEEEKKEKEEEKSTFSFNFGGEEPKDEEEEVAVPGPYRVARKVPVKLGFTNDELAEVEGGVAAGDAVVVVGQSALRDGSRVRLPEDPAMPKPEPEEGEEGPHGDEE